MKKFLALLFVCAGLTAMAAPHINKADFVQANKGQMVMKSNTMANQLTAGVNKSFMEAAKKAVQRNHAENLVNQRAPKRLSDADMIGLNSICFLYAYDVMGDEPVPADPLYAGRGAYWYPEIDEGLYFAGFYWDSKGSTYYLPLEIDYTTGEVALPWGLELKDDSVIGTARNRTDTVWYELLVSQDYWESQQQNDCMGTLYTDGSIIFDDNYVYYTYREERVYANRVLQRTDVFETATMFVGTEIITANGTHDFDYEYNGTHFQEPVYMFQNDAKDTLFVGNMYGFSMPSVALNVTADGQMIYNCIGEVDEEGTVYLDNPIYDLDPADIDGGLGYAYGTSGYTLDDEGYVDEILWGFEGLVVPEKVTWEYSSWSNGYHLYYGFQNNVLQYTNGNLFALPTPAPVGMRGDADDNQAVNIADVTAIIDALLSQDWDSINYDNSDCNLDGTVNIADVTALIDYLLSGEWVDE